MPRQARLDAPGVLHHVMARGIERREIFRDDRDRDRFVERLGALARGSSLIVYAWSLMPNHFHLLVRTGVDPLSRSLRRLLTGYAGDFNRRHRRHGHLVLLDRVSGDGTIWSQSPGDKGPAPRLVQERGS